MNRIISLGLIGIGALYIVYGGIAMESLRPHAPGMYTNLPASHAVWLLFAGAFAAFAGLLAEASVVRPMEA